LRREVRLRRRAGASRRSLAPERRGSGLVADPAQGEEAAPPVGPRAVVRLLKTREFGPYFFGNALSASGGWFQNLAAAILVYRLTGSELLLGVLTFANFAPMLVLAPWTGSAADRFDRRKLLLLTQPVSALLAGVLALVTALDVATAPLVICLVLAVGVVSAFSVPAQMALIASLVPPRDLPSAVALNSMTFNIARAAGPLLAALTIATIGIAEAFAINAATFLLFTLALLTLRPRAQERAARGESGLRDSLLLVRREPRLLAYLLVVTAVGFASDPVNTLAPAFAEEFGYPDTVSGLIIGAFGAGAVAAAFFVAGRAAGSRRRMTAALALMGCGMVAFSLSPWLGLGFVFLFLAGVGYLSANTAATSRLQLEVSESQRGRIMALWTVAFLGLRPLASLVDGAVASAFGVRFAGILLALPALACAAGLLLLGEAPRRQSATASPRGGR
jgi:MFS family permease